MPGPRSAPPGPPPSTPPCGVEVLGGHRPTGLHFPQISQAIEEVHSTNRELLRKYRRELQLRKKCHNELVRLKGVRGVVSLRWDRRDRGASP